MKKIVLTGGGTAGHVTPNIALMPQLRQRGYDITYIGSIAGMEKGMIEEEGIPYYGIETGKLRRYFSPQNFSDPFRVIKGCAQAGRLLRKIRPNVIFSKGGFVSVPVVLAAKMLKIPVVIHESDMTPGLANKICIPAAARVCCNFPETVKYLPEGKALLTGSPIRQELFDGDREKGLAFCGLKGKKPVLLVIGGSLGAAALNQAIWDNLDELLKKYEVIHLCGKGKTKDDLGDVPGYVQYEFISEELADLLAAADLVISRAGANSICELVALKKPNILVPLPASASRGDQILNARSFKKQGFSFLLPEEKITGERLLKVIDHVYKQRDSYVKAMEESPQNQAINKIVDLLDQLAD